MKVQFYSCFSQWLHFWKIQDILNLGIGGRYLMCLDVKWSQSLGSRNHKQHCFVRFRSPSVPAFAPWVPEWQPHTIPGLPGRITGASLQLTASLQAEGHFVICWSFYSQPNGLFTLYLHYQGPGTLTVASLFFFFFSNLCTSSAFSLVSKGDNTSRNFLLTHLKQPCSQEVSSPWLTPQWILSCSRPALWNINQLPCVLPTRNGSSWGLEPLQLFLRTRTIVSASMS